MNRLSYAIDEFDHAARRFAPISSEWLVAKSKLAYVLKTRFDLTQFVEDLNRAILAREKLNSFIQLKTEHVNQIHLSQILRSRDLLKRFDLMRLLKDSEKTIDILQRNVTLDVGSNEQAMNLCELSSALQAQFLKTRAVEKLIRAIEAGRRATQFEGDVIDNERRTAYFEVLGNALHLSCH